MLGTKAKLFSTLIYVSPDNLVTRDNFFRYFEAKLDMNFVHDLVRDHYSSISRHSIDPVVFKRHFIAFFEGIDSERQLIENVNLI